ENGWRDHDGVLWQWRLAAWLRCAAGPHFYWRLVGQGRRPRLGTAKAATQSSDGYAIYGGTAGCRGSSGTVLSLGRCSACEATVGSTRPADRRTTSSRSGRSSP